MICGKCEGKGWYDNPKYPNPVHYSYAGEPTLRCRKCRGIGYVIGNVNDVLDFLKHLEVKFEKDKEYLPQVKQCIDTIEKY